MAACPGVADDACVTAGIETPAVVLNAAVGASANAATGLVKHAVAEVPAVGDNTNMQRAS